MPTPQWKRDLAIKRRERNCLVCGTFFIASRPSAKGFCSRACQDKNFSAITTGRRHTQETKQKMSASGKAWRKTNPEWEQRRRDAAIEACRTDEYRSAALDRYLAMTVNGSGICSESVRKFTANRAKWVLTKAREALNSETDFADLWRITQERLRQEMPFDGQEDSDDYFEYARKLGKAVACDPAIRKFQDDFFKEAIPRFSKAYSELFPQNEATHPAQA